MKHHKPADCVSTAGIYPPVFIVVLILASVGGGQVIIGQAKCREGDQS